MKLRIDRFEVFGVEMPMVGTFTSAGFAKKTMKCVVLRITASDGTVGISSLEPPSNIKSPGTAPELITSLRERVAPAIIGMDPTNIQRLIELLESLLPTQPHAIAGVEMAAIDLAARVFGVPLSTYLGGTSQSSVEFNAWIGMLSPDEAAADALRWFKAGFRSAKIKVGGGVESDHDRIAAVRSAVGSAMQLRIDANGQYDAETSLQLARMIRQYDLQLFEQPAPKDDLAGMARVRREGCIPVMADESITDHPSMVAVIKADAADFIKFGVKQAGGILRAAHMLATAEAARIQCVVGHGFGLDPSTIAEIMLAAASRNVLAGLECVGPLKMTDTIATTRLDVSSGSFTLPDRPGIGIELDDTKLEQYRLQV